MLIAKNTFFLGGLASAIYFGWQFANLQEDAGFVVYLLPDGQPVFCNQLFGSSPDASVVPLMGALPFLVSVVIRIIRLRRKFGFLEQVLFGSALLFCLIANVALTGCGTPGVSLWVVPQPSYWIYWGGLALAVVGACLRCSNPTNAEV